MTGRQLATAIALTGCLVAAGCGGDAGDDTVALTQKTVVSVPPATTPTTLPTTTTARPEGDEEATKIPAAFTVSADGATITPKTITVPAFFPVEVSVTSTGGEVQATLEGPDGPQTTLTAADRKTTSTVLPPLEPGDYTLRTARGATATLHTSRDGAVGP